MKSNYQTTMNIRNMAGRFLMIAVAALLLNPSFATAQDGDGGGDGGGAAENTGGVEIDADGVLSLRAIPQNSQQLNLQRAAAAKAALNRDLAAPSKMRKVSLNRLEAEIKKLKAAGQNIPDDMKYLAGMTRITHVFFYPESKDIVIAGPAEGFFRSAENRVLGVNTGAATLKLQDLVVALRAFGPDGNLSLIHI